MTDGFDVAALFDRLPIPLYATSRDGEVLAANKAFWEIWESRDEDKATVRTENLYADPSERRRVIEELDKSDIELIDWEQLIDTPTGIRWIQPLARVVRDEAGIFQRFEGGFVTITTPDSGGIEQQQRVLLERTTDPVLILDPHGQIIWANASARQILRVTEATLRSRPSLAEVADVDTPFSRVIADAPYSREVTFDVKGRRGHFWVNLEVHLGADGEPAFYSLIGRDLAALDDARSRLAASVMEKDRVLETVAHEVRTPLTSVLGLSTELAQRLASSGNNEDAELAALLAAEAQDMARIVEDLMDSAERAHAVPRQFVPVDLHREARKAVQTCGLTEDEVDITGEARAMGDPAWIRRIIVNLITNARRYGMPPLTVRAEASGESAHLLVIDHGPGVPAQLIRSVFEPYVTEGSSGSGALGLGLTVSRSLAQDMGGSLAYARDEGTTVFDLRLPRSNAR